MVYEVFLGWRVYVFGGWVAFEWVGKEKEGKRGVGGMFVDMETG